MADITVEELIHAGRQLPGLDRQRVIAELQMSLILDEEPEYLRKWDRALAERLAHLENGLDQGEPMQELLDEFQAALDAREAGR